MQPRRFKLTTAENWLEPDPLCEALVKINRSDGTVYPMDGRDWIDYVNTIHLAERVPQDVRDAYEFIRGAVGYGYFYYPLFTIVSQQMLRIADFAVQRLFEIRRDLPKPKRRAFEARLAVLRDTGFLDDGGAKTWEDAMTTGQRHTPFWVWDAIRRLRNSATHPEWQQTWGHDLRLIRDVAELVSALPWPEQSNPDSETAT